MKLLANISRILVGLEFIFSGFVKVVDPYGTSIKLHEYFDVFAKDVPALAGFFGFFAENSIPLSIAFCASELILGVAMLVKFKMKFSSWFALLLMLFFTFLTFYTAYYNKVTDCGCFGDFLVLKPWTSFWKDVITMVFILIIFAYRSKFTSYSFSNAIVAFSTIIALIVGIYGIVYLPIQEFVPYAVGKSISKQMEKPAIKPDFRYTFFDKTKNTQIESKEYLMDTTKYKFVEIKTLNEDELKPKITDYSLSDEQGNSYTDSSLMGKKLMLIIKSTKNLEKVNFGEIKKIVSFTESQSVEPMLVTSLLSKDIDAVKKKNNLNSKVYFIDEKVAKTMARNNPVLYLLENGTVLQKWPYNDLPSTDDLKKLINHK
ncbi:MAG: BT_3928 family protein [Leadbetterella sp.]